jgi:hypothetical protein
MQECVHGRLTCRPGPRSPAAWGCGWPRRGRSVCTLHGLEVGQQGAEMGQQGAGAGGVMGGTWRRWGSADAARPLPAPLRPRSRLLLIRLHNQGRPLCSQPSRCCDGWQNGPRRGEVAKHAGCRQVRTPPPPPSLTPAWMWGGGGRR